MTTALESVANLTVRTISRAFDQAAVLLAEHAVSQDSSEALTINSEVSYTDPDLGLMFKGRIVGVDEQWQEGEGILYTCADPYRVLTKEPALVNGSAKIEIVEGRDSVDVLTNILNEFIAKTGSSVLPGGFDFSSMSSFNLEPINMSGQSIAEWINRIISQTPDDVAYVTYDTIGDAKLIIQPASNAPDLVLKKGEFELVNPEEGDNPLIVRGQFGATTDDKYSEVVVEGCGEFARRNLIYLPPEMPPTRNAPGGNIFTYRFKIPEKWATPRHLDANSKCREDWFARVQIGVFPSFAVVDIHNLGFEHDEVTGEFFFVIKIVSTGVIFGTVPPVPQLQAWFTYTAYQGPLISTAASSSIFNEGTLHRHRPDYYKFTGDTNHDDTSLMDRTRDTLFSRHCIEADRAGNLAVHIKGLDPDVVLGAKITVPSELGDPSVRVIAYDFINRDINLDCSDVPLRSEVSSAFQRARERTEIGGDWYISKDSVEPSCLCGGEVYTDDKGDARSPRRTGGAARSRTSYDCVMGFCVERDDDSGEFKTLQKCEEECFATGYEFVACVGCVKSTSFWPTYETEAQCVSANPNPFDPSFSCGSGASAPVPPVTSLAETQDWSCLGLSCGPIQEPQMFFLGFIRRLKVNRGGHVILAECEEIEFQEISGFTGSVPYLADASAQLVGASLVSMNLCYNYLVFSHGIFISAENPCSVQSAISITTSNMGVVLKPKCGSS